MKTLLLITIAFGVFAILPHRSYALDDQDKIQDLQQTELENEHEELATEEIKTSQQISAEQAEILGQQASEARQKLLETRAQKRAVEKKAKRQIANSEWLRTLAQRHTNRDNQEMERLKGDVAQREKEMNVALAARNKAQAIAQDARAKLNKIRSENKRLALEIKQAQQAQAVAKRETEKLEHQRMMVMSETKVLRVQAQKASAAKAYEQANWTRAHHRLEKAKERKVAATRAPHA